MKELEQVHEVPMGTRTLKSLLKKPGHSKQRSHKNRVTINEKLNEFFAADYIILIKEECCGDYEEECDCCCQEPEMIRLGNCKECRAEFTRQLAAGDIDTRFATERNGNKIIDNGCDVSRRVGGGVGGCISVGGMGIGGSEESQEDEDEEDDDEEEEYEEEVDDDDNDEAESSEEADQRNNSGDPMTPVQLQTQTHETLSPPEGYKDVCDEDMQTEQVNDMCPVSTGAVVVCGECNYYRQRTPDGDKDVEEDGNRNTQIDESAQKTLEQSQQTTPDVHQRYLVETITMTTVTERRIVREISEDKGTAITNNSSVTLAPTEEDQTDKPAVTNPTTEETNGSPDNTTESPEDPDKPKSNSPDKETDKETPETNDLMPFKLGNSLVNSLKPNSAVRQLFPNPKFISPPPALTKGISLSNDEGTDSDSEAQRYLVTTESLRLFDSVKRAKMAGSRSDSSESDSSTIKRTIERNALRRSLVCKYDTLTRKKNLMSKDVSLEERIRQLTCVDPEEDTTCDSASDSLSADQNHLGVQGQDLQDLPARTSPNGEERPLGKNDRNCPEHSPSPPLHHHHHHHHYHHHHHNPAYKKITDLFGQKKIDNMPDLGLGDRSSPKTSSSKLSSDRKQFLASLAPLSCVASTGIDGNDYYQVASKISRDSMGYGSDSSYSLEDIEAALRGDERNNKTPGPPDVTRGTPTGVGPDASDTTDELLAFVEQDKSRTERLKRRYDTEDKEDKNGQDEDDDELNDYGFNRRPAVRGIKPQFESSSEIVRQLRYRTIPASIVDKRQAPWPYYDTDNHHLEKRVTFTSTAAAAAVGVGLGVGVGVGVGVEPDEISIAASRDSTINRINTMQRQIDDIYQTIAESALSIQGTLDRGSYLESTLPRGVSSRLPVVPPPPLPPAECRYQETKTGVPGHFQETPRMRMTTEMPMYSTLSKPRRTVAISNYPCGVVPIESSTKCYRTMYLVPYNGLSDPTYQNIQRILPPHSSASYADHIERYPYPRNVEADGTQVPRYYPRAPGSSQGGGGHVTPAIVPPPPLHLRLQPEDMGFNPGAGVGMQTILQHQHISQLATYNVQSVPAYTVVAPSRPGYPYPVHPRGSLEIQGQPQSQPQTGSLPPTMTTNTVASGFNGNHHLACTSSSSSTSSALSSPTKTSNANNLCSTAERGVPEGAASAPAHDFVSQANNVTYGHNVPPPNTQNSVYYAMNV